MKKNPMKALAQLLLSAVVLTGLARGQAPDTTLRRDLPRLEIPEITIVGKKAITLPFARKGEIFEVPVYEAPPPDSGLLADRPPLLLPEGTLPRYQQREMPWRISAEGTAGSYGTFGARGFIDYHTQDWNLSTTAGFRRTGGHVTNADGSEFDAGGKYTSLVSTDNDILKNFRFSGNFDYRHDRFGLFGLLPAGTERARDIFGISAAASSIRRSGLVLDLSLGTDIFSVTDSWSGVDSGVTVTSPELKVAVTGDVADYRIISEFRYISSSLDYQREISSPSLFSLLGAVQWRLTGNLFLKAGGEFSNGSGSAGESRSHAGPMAELEWEIDAGRKIDLHFRSGMEMSPYSELAREIPYVSREITILPEEKDADVGGSLWYNSGMLTLELSGSYIISNDRRIIVSDGGRIGPVYSRVWRVPVRLDGSVLPRQDIRVKFNAVLEPSREKGGNVQLPMVPIARFGAEIEYDLPGGWTVSGGSRWWSRRNVDRAGAGSLGAVFLLDASVSTTVIPRMVLTAGVRNLGGTEYSWWQSYRARGLDIFLIAKAIF